MQLTGDEMDPEVKLEVDVEKSRLLCKEECTGTGAAEVELDDEESHLVYIIDSFAVENGRGTIQNAMVIRGATTTEAHHRRPGTQRHLHDTYTSVPRCVLRIGS